MKNLVLSLVCVIGAAGGTAWAADKAPAGHDMPGHAGAAMADHPTCGQMMSSMATIPAKLSEGADSVANMLEAHVALLGKDKDSVAEAKGMRALVKSHKQVAADLKKTSDEMKNAASWPMAPHDMAKMKSDPKLNEAQKRVIEVHKEIIAMLQKMVSDMEAQQKMMK